MYQVPTKLCIGLIKEINNFYIIQIVLRFTTILALSLILAGLCDIIRSNSYKTGEWTNICKTKKPKTKP